MRGAREREAQAFADDLVVVHDQTGDLFASLPVFHHGLQDCMRQIGWSLVRVSQKPDESTYTASASCSAITGGSGSSLTLRRSRTPCSFASALTCSRSGFVCSLPR